MNDKVALVTGASTGIGQHISDTLVNKGYTVYGTSRSKQPDRNGVQMRQLEVSDQASVDACISSIMDETGGIDLLVNNAAIVHVSPEEELPIDVAQAMMNINFFGAARVTNAVLPQMRQRRDGQLIFISSLAGQMGVPGQGYYCSTKHAMEAYADSLYLELQQFGIRVSVLEPGSYRTGILDQADKAPTWQTFNDYDDMRVKLPKVIMEQTKKSQDPQLVANLVVKVAANRTPRLRYQVSSADKRAVQFKRWLPEKMFYKTIGQMFGL
ncbi:MAG: SDR family NAD(P)-dependent oxidoreductase [Chloroflexota bacterium]